MDTESVEELGTSWGSKLCCFTAWLGRGEMMVMAAKSGIETVNIVAAAAAARRSGQGPSAPPAGAGAGVHSDSESE